MLDPNDKEVPDEELEDVVVPEEEADPAAPKVVDLDEEEEAEKEFKGLDNKAFAAMRKEAAEAKREREELRKKVQEYEKRAQQTPAYTPPAAPPAYPTAPRPTYNGVPIPQSRQEWDALARQDWKLAVDMSNHVASQRAIQEYETQRRASVALEESKQRVLQKHPELGDVNSEKSKIFLQILDRNPEYLTMNKGPVLAMRDMEDEMERLGFTREQIFESKKVTAQQEAARASRAALTGGGRMPEKQGRTVQLSKDDIEFCTSQGLDPEEYAKQKLELENARKGAQL
jgi:hypothetical protein